MVLCIAVLLLQYSVQRAVYIEDAQLHCGSQNHLIDLLIVACSCVAKSNANKDPMRLNFEADNCRDNGLLRLERKAPRTAPAAKPAMTPADRFTLCLRTGLSNLSSLHQSANQLEIFIWWPVTIVVTLFAFARDMQFSIPQPKSSSNMCHRVTGNRRRNKSTPINKATITGAA